MTVLDASPVLALVHDQPGADAVAEALPGSTLGAPKPTSRSPQTDTHTLYDALGYHAR